MELELYSTIEYTPGWYYSKYPKFWNVECYKVLSDYSNNPQKYNKEDKNDVEAGVEEMKTAAPEDVEPLFDMDVEQEHLLNKNPVGTDV